MPIGVDYAVLCIWRYYFQKFDCIIRKPIIGLHSAFAGLLPAIGKVWDAVSDPIINYFKISRVDFIL